MISVSVLFCLTPAFLIRLHQDNFASETGKAKLALYYREREFLCATTCCSCCCCRPLEATSLFGQLCLNPPIYCPKRTNHLPIKPIGSQTNKQTEHDSLSLERTLLLAVRGFKVAASKPLKLSATCKSATSRRNNSHFVR